jgi:hypothetical protein
MFCAVVVVAGAAAVQRRFMHELPEAWRGQSAPFFDVQQQLDVLQILATAADDDADKENVAPVDYFFGVEH